MNILVVVDMQHKYQASLNEALQRRVAKEIQVSMAQDEPILFLELGWERTIPYLSALVRDYGYAVFIKKNGGDGSTAIKQTTDILRIFSPTTFRLVGVNCCACVADTATGLRYEFPESRVIAVLDAMGCLGYKEYAHACENATEKFVRSGVIMDKIRKLGNTDGSYTGGIETIAVRTPEVAKSLKAFATAKTTQH